MGFRALFYLSRFVRISALSVSFVVAFLAQHLLGMGHGPRLLRWYLESCGGGFIKVGQLLAMRLDILGAKYQHELSRLLDHTTAAPFEEIVEIIELDLGRKLEDCFLTVDAKPVASASIAQVHFGLLHGGAQVAVKVKRPGIARRLQIDLFYLRLLARWIAWTRFLGKLDVVGLVSELSRLTLRELDFRQEAIHTQYIHEFMRQDRIDHCAPRVDFEYSGDDTITMERLEGLSLKSLMAAVQENDFAQLQEWAERGISPHRTARILSRSLLEQTLRHRVFHADPHVANLMVLDGGTLAFLDFGIVGHIDEDTAEKIGRVYQNMTRRDIHGTYTALLRAAEYVPGGDLSSLETELKLIIGDWTIASASPHATHKEKSNGRFLFHVMGAMRRSNVRFRWEIVSLFRTAFVSDKLAYTLHPKLNPGFEIAEFFRDERDRRLRESFGDDALRESVLDLLETTIALPNTLRRLNELVRKSAEFKRTSGEPLGGLYLAFAHFSNAGRRAAWMVVLFFVAAKLALDFGMLENTPRNLQAFVGDYWWLAALLAGLVAFTAGNVYRSTDREAN